MKATAKDLLNMDNVPLLSQWIVNQVQTFSLDNIEKAIAAYDMLGREGVACVLEGQVELEERVVPIKLDTARKMLFDLKANNDPRFFHVEFVKRTDGAYRKMDCRLGVKKHLKGGDQGYEPATFDLLTVWDKNAEPKYTKEEKAQLEEGIIMPKDKGGFRSINITELVRLTISGVKFIVEENRDLLQKIG